MPSDPAGAADGGEAGGVPGDASRAVRLFEGTTVDRPEIVIGLVAALGTDLRRVETALAEALQFVGYRTTYVRVSDLIAEEEARLPARGGKPRTLIDRRMDQGDALRKAGFYAEWKGKFGDAAWKTLEDAVGGLA